MRHMHTVVKELFRPEVVGILGPLPQVLAQQKPTSYCMGQRIAMTANISFDEVM